MDDLMRNVPEEDREWLAVEMAHAEEDFEDEPCRDNDRLADVSKPDQVAAFEDAERQGCCGQASFRFGPAPSGATYVWGFNYGH